VSDFTKVVAEAMAHYEALSPSEKWRHDYTQRRSFVRGMCPSDHDFKKWCEVVDRLMPPLPPSQSETP